MILNRCNHSLIIDVQLVIYMRFGTAVAFCVGSSSHSDVKEIDKVGSS